MNPDSKAATKKEKSHAKTQRRKVMSNRFKNYSAPAAPVFCRAPMRDSQTLLLRKKSMQQTFSIPFCSKVVSRQRQNVSLFFAPLREIFLCLALRILR
jgi:hypothetical protein